MNASDLLLLFFIFIGFVILCISIYKISNIIHRVKSKLRLIEIIPPYHVEQSPYATEQFLNILFALGKQSSLNHKIFGIKKVFSLEVASSREEGIRYFICAALEDIEIIKKHLIAFLPGVRINVTSDYLPKTENQSWSTTSLKLSKSFSLPLNEQSKLAQHDPMAYITGQMTKLNKDEKIAVQFILSSADYDASSFNLFSIILNGLLFLILTPFTLLGWLIFQDKKEVLPIWLFNKNQQNTKVTNEKINKNLFETTIRLYIEQKSQQSIKSRMKGLLTAFASYRNENQQELVVKKQLPYIKKLYILKWFFYLQMKYRLSTLTQYSLLSVAEVASLFHFPYTSTTKTEDLVHTKSKKLPAPLSLKQSARKVDSVFAQNNFAGTRTPIGLTKEERRRHMYILGATGAGKTTLLSTMIKEDIINGKGVCVIDPHGNLLDLIIPAIPKERYKDVILFDPDDTEYPIGLNLLSLPKNVSTKELQRQKEFITSSLISIITKLYPPRYTGPRMEYILRNATLTALETENPTLFTIQKLLIDSTYRKKVIPKLTNPALILFWTKEFQQMGSYQKAEAVFPITNKLGKFITSSLSANILGQKHSKLNFSEILDTNKILLCDLSKGKIGEDFSSLFGSLITAEIQLAALKRVRMPEILRNDFYLYIDEFQNFATPSFAQILSEARKYRLNAILAHQTIAQIEDHDLVKVILANTGSIICFRTGSPIDEEFIMPFFVPEVVKGEIANLPLYNFYMKINGIESQNSFSGETIYEPVNFNYLTMDKIRSITRTRYSRPKDQIEQDIQQELYHMQVKKTKAVKRSLKANLPEEQSLF